MHLPLFLLNMHQNEWCCLSGSHAVALQLVLKLALHVQAMHVADSYWLPTQLMQACNTSAELIKQPSSVLPIKYHEMPFTA